MQEKKWGSSFEDQNVVFHSPEKNIRGLSLAVSIPIELICCARCEVILHSLASAITVAKTWVYRNKMHCSGQAAVVKHYNHIWDSGGIL